VREVAEPIFLEEVLAAQEDLAIYANVHVIDRSVHEATRERPTFFLDPFVDLDVDEAAATARIDRFDRGGTAESLDDPLALCRGSKFVGLKVNLQGKFCLLESPDISFHAVIVVTAVKLAISVGISGWKVHVEL
jgi:hypothetical protein